MGKIDTAGRLSSKEAANRIGLTVKTLAMMRMRGDGPEYLKLGNRIRYEPGEVSRWIDSKRMTKVLPQGSRVGAEQHT